MEYLSLYSRSQITAGIKLLFHLHFQISFFFKTYLANQLANSNKYIHAEGYAPSILSLFDNILKHIKWMLLFYLPEFLVPNQQ